MIYIAQAYPVPVEIVAIIAAQCEELQPLDYSEMERWEVFAFDNTSAIHFKCRFADHILAQETLPNEGAEFVIDDCIGDQLRQWLEQNASADIIAMQCSLVEFVSKAACERFENEFIELLGSILPPGADLKVQCQTIINYA